MKDFVMKKGYLFTVLVHLIVFPLTCAYQRNNPIDEGGSKFVPPQISINEDASSVKDLDTIHFDSITVVLEGNMDRSVFRMKIDTGVWAIDWRPEGSFGVGELSDGSHVLVINSMYEGGEMVVADTIRFHVLTKGYKPEFGKADDTTITSFGGKPVVLIARAEGASPLNFSWIKVKGSPTGKNKDTLALNSFSKTDTGSYKCVVSNEYGVDTSRTFILKLRPSTGGIKGIVTDTAEKILKGAKVALSPSVDIVTTGSDGKFEFTGLGANTYSLKISLTGYEDKTVDDIKVNDSVVVDIKGSELLWIDTTIYKVTYFGNGNESGKVPVDSTKYKPNSKVAVLDNIGSLAIKGHTFLKWNTKKDGSGDSLNPADSFSITDNTSLYAQWKINQHTVSFNGNNSTSGSAPEDRKYNYDEKVTIPAGDSLKRAGYTFEGWNIQQNGEGKAYAAQDTFSMPDSNVVLYAQWKAMPTFKVTYDKNGADSGTAPVDSDNYYRGKEVTIAGNPGKLLKDGYSFAGWNAKADRSGESYNAGSKFSMPDSAVTFYVKWSTNPTYSIIYHGNTNSGGKEPSTVESDSGDQVTIADSGSLMKTGYTFVEWNSKEDGSGKSYGIGTQITMDIVDIDLYAKWTKAKYTVTYHGNGSTGGTIPAKTTHLYESDVTVSSGEPTRTGHTFQSWNTDSAGGGLDYVSGNGFKMGADNVDLYAKWTKKKYTITFSGNGERTSDVPAAVEVEYGTKIDSSSYVSSRESYVFGGWFKEPSCVSKWQYQTDFVASNDTLYAKWVIKDIDGNVYTEVKIGDQVWMVENLKVTRYNDSSLIPYITTAAAWGNLYTCEENPCRCYPGYCWYDNDSTTNHIYGALYNWGVIGTNLLAPTGWHVPTESELRTLANLIGGVDIAGGKMKEIGTLHWNPPNEGATDSVGFKALPGGFRNPDGTFENIKNDGCWWTTGQITASTKVGFCITKDNFNLDVGWKGGTSGFSVRCLRSW